MANRILTAKTPPIYCQQCGHHLVENSYEDSEYDVLTGEKVVIRSWKRRFCSNEMARGIEIRVPEPHPVWRTTDEGTWVRETRQRLLSASITDNNDAVATWFEKYGNRTDA